MNSSDYSQPSGIELPPKNNCILPITNKPEIYFVTGKGDYLFDHKGEPYLDLIQGWAVNTLGHCPEVIQKALIGQSQKLINSGPAFYNAPMIELANTLCKHSVFDQVFFANSGAEANESAIKLARKWGQVFKGGASKIITFDQGFHGRTLATMSATGKASFSDLYEPKVPGFSKVPFNLLSAVKDAIDSNTVAIMLELIQGEAGVIPASQAFVKGLREFCDQHNLLLIVDEVQTGIGRTGTLFCYEHYAIQPDIMTLGKGLGGGFPISAMLTHKKFSCFEAGDQGGTFNGNPLACSVSHAVVNEVISPSVQRAMKENSEYLKARLNALCAKYSLPAIRGKGMLLAMDTGTINAPDIVKSALESGLLLNAPRLDTLRFMPALNIKKETIDGALQILEKIFSEELKSRSKGNDPE